MKDDWQPRPIGVLGRSRGRGSRRAGAAARLGGRRCGRRSAAGGRRTGRAPGRRPGADHSGTRWRGLPRGRRAAARRRRAGGRRRGGGVLRRRVAGLRGLGPAVRVRLGRRAAGGVARRPRRGPPRRRAPAGPQRAHARARGGFLLGRDDRGARPGGGAGPSRARRRGPDGGRLCALRGRRPAGAVVLRDRGHAPRPGARGRFQRPAWPTRSRLCGSRPGASSTRSRERPASACSRSTTGSSSPPVRSTTATCFSPRSTPCRRRSAGPRLLDAIVQALELHGEDFAHKAIVLFSDGDDRDSLDDPGDGRAADSRGPGDGLRRHPGPRARHRGGADDARPADAGQRRPLVPHRANRRSRRCPDLHSQRFCETSTSSATGPPTPPSTARGAASRCARAIAATSCGPGKGTWPRRGTDRRRATGLRG